MGRGKNNPKPDFIPAVQYSGVSPDVAYALAAAFRDEVKQKEKRIAQLEAENKRLRQWLGIDANTIEH